MADGNEIVPATRDGVERNVQAGVMYRVGGRSYPMRSVPQCKTCQSHFRLQVEDLIIRGYAYEVIVRDLDERAGLSRRNLEDHVSNGHMPLREVARRVVLDRRAEEIGLDEYQQSLVEQVGFAKNGLQQVYEMMANGTLIPTIDHGIAFMKFLQQIEEEAGADLDREMLQQSILTYQDAIVRHASPEIAKRIAREIQADPVLSRLVAKRNAIEAVAEDLDDDDD